MSDLKRHRPYLVWGLLAVVVTLVLVVLVLPGGAWVALDQRRSAERTTPDGVAAWARSLGQLGVPVGRRYTPFDLVPPAGRGLAILEAIEVPSAGEVHAVLEWVRSGGTLVYSPGFRDPMADSLGIRLVGGGGDDPFAMIERRDSLVEHPWTDTPVGFDDPGRWKIRPEVDREEAWVPLTDASSMSASLAWMPEGEGGVLVVADAEELANRTLADSEIAITATRVFADLMAGDTLVFSEYHQGLGGSRGLVRESLSLASSLPAGRILVHFAITAVVLFLLAGRRFGAPLPEPPGPRRSTLEHVNASAHIFRSARSYGTVAHYLIRSAARRMRLPVGVGSDEALVESWRARPKLTESATRASQALAADPPDLSALEHALDQVVHRHDTFRPRS